MRLELPRIGDETIVQQLDDTCTDILARLDQETKKQGAADLDVGIGWHKPPDIAPISRPSSRSSDHRRISQQPTQSPYSWITSAFVGNRVGQNARAQTHQKILTKDPMQDVLKPAFEYWVVQLHIEYTDASIPLEKELSSFLCTHNKQLTAVAALAFGDKYQSAVPAIMDAGICPFPFTIDSAVRL
ncbi:hypothetical protein MVES1_000154 [Malassezia vespertilionis]|uniref:uncharacterized protein n=1 Tax=Malassezia vespertilionis TaxID=2020962 RepID=UPI0024B21026|nr:uncharacterized protein MVES1_000154 [Malassezia vespertilionis]WFD04830.1 hypothetical protein MVES1_000154 [Malassezia vespertilionis]